MESIDNKYRVLIVDDEEDICDILQYNLVKEGYVVDTAQSAEEALFKMKNEYHLLLLDIMLGGISGLKLAQILRKDYGNDVPIIFISALGSESDVITGFDKGGDDYISKPFSIKEVIARVKAVLHRVYASHSADEENTGAKEPDKYGRETFVYDGIFINYRDKIVQINGVEVLFTKKEYEILVLFSKNLNKIFSRDDILKLVWKEESYVLERTVDVHIARLRKKLAEYGDMIVNRSGYGYSMHIS